MANECLITKLKGTVVNPNLKRFGEVTVGLRNSDGTANFNNVLEVYAKAPIHYECSGITDLKLVNGSLVTIETLPMSGELQTGRNYLLHTGEGSIKLWEKYSFTTLVVREKDVVENISEYRKSYMDADFGINWEGPKDICYDSIDYPTVFKPNAGNNAYILLPLIKNLNYGNVEMAGITENTVIRILNFKQGGIDFNLVGDFANIANLEQPISMISIWDTGANRNFYISDFSRLTPVCADTCAIVVLIGCNQSLMDQNPSELATWKKLTSINFKCSDTFEWKPIFDSWNTIADYRGKTVEIWINGTYNGEPIDNLHHVIFDSVNSYTVTA